MHTRALCSRSRLLGPCEGRMVKGRLLIQKDLSTIQDVADVALRREGGF